MLTVDLETHKAPGEEKLNPDFRTDIVDRVGWLEEGAETAQWSKCFCLLPGPNGPYLMHNALYDLGIMARQTVNLSGFLRAVEIEDTIALAYCQGEEDLSLKGLMQKYLGVQTVTYSQQELIGEDQFHAQDLWGTQRLFPILKDRQRGTCYNIDRALIPALIDCSYRGYEIDHYRLAAATARAEGVVTRAEASWAKLVGAESVLLSRRKVTRKRWPTDTAGLYGDDIVVGEGPTRYRESYGTPGINSPIQLQRYFGVDSVNKDFLRDMAREEGPRSLAAFLRQQWVAADKLLDTYFYPAQGREKLTGLFNITPSEDMEG
jgi:hypothetical protein